MDTLQTIANADDRQWDYSAFGQSLETRTARVARHIYQLNSWKLITPGTVLSRMSRAQYKRQCLIVARERCEESPYKGAKFHFTWGGQAHYGVHY